MKQALEALDAPSSPMLRIIQEEAITSLRQAIEQAEKQEPVAWMSSHDVGFKRSEFGDTPTVPLYTTPQPQRKWVGLTDEEIQALASWWPSYDQMPALKVLIKDVTNSLKEKNT